MTDLYEVFDSYLEVDTWHTGEYYDDHRFIRAIRQVIDNPDFSPERMADYFRTKTGVDREHPLSRAIEDRTTQAWAIKHYVHFEP